MSIMKHIIQEELERQKSLKERYTEILNGFPKGSISVKNRRGKPYAYLAFREGPKVKFKYIGKDTSNKVEELKAQIAKRNHYKELAKEVDKNLEELEKMLNG